MNQNIEQPLVQRLKEVFADSNKKSVRAFALSIDGDPSYVAKMLNGERPVTESVATSIQKVYNVRMSWLLYGKGEKFGQNEDSSGQHLPGAVTLQDHIALLQRWRDDAESKYQDAHKANMALIDLLKTELKQVGVNLARGQQEIKEQILVTVTGAVQQLSGVVPSEPVPLTTGGKGIGGKKKVGDGDGKSKDQKP